MENMLTEFFDSKFLNHYNEDIKQVAIKSADDYKKLTDPYEIVIKVNVKNIEDCVGVSDFDLETVQKSDDEDIKRIVGKISIYARLERENRFYPDVVVKSIGDLLESFMMDFYRNKRILILINNHSSLLSYSDVVSLYVETFVSEEFQLYENMDLMIACNDDIKKVEDIFLEKKKEKKEKKKSKKNKKK